MSDTPTTSRFYNDLHYKTPKKSTRSPTKRVRTPSLKSLENLATSESAFSEENYELNKDLRKSLRRSARKCSPPKKYYDEYVIEGGGETCGLGAKKKPKRIPKNQQYQLQMVDSDDNTENEQPPEIVDKQLYQEDLVGVAGRSIFGFNTPKKRGAMALAALNTPKMVQTPKNPKTPKTPKTPKVSKASKNAQTPKTSKTPNTPKSSRKDLKTPTSKSRKLISETKTPSRVRRQLKNQITKLVEESSQSDFSEEESEYEPRDSDVTFSGSASDSSSSAADDAGDDEPKTPMKGRKPIIVPVLPKTPSAARLRQSARIKRTADYVPESDGYFQSQSFGKILTSDHTLDRLNNPRLPADRIFSLLAEMKIRPEHEESINAIMEEYRTYFPKWLCVLNEGFNILLYGLGSKRQLLQSFHREVLALQPVLVINGFFPSLTLKDILDSITKDILDAGPSASNPHEAVDMIDEEFALIPETHLYLIVHNLDGVTLRNEKTQSILARLATVPNIHLLASIDHINTPLLWDHTKLRNFNFSWWDCTTMLPYTDETAFENSLLVQNSGELALSSMRSVFSSLTTNSRGIYMLIVKYQLKNKTNANYQGMPFKELYSLCREAFLVSSDLALRANLTEFLDHKLVKSKRNIDGAEQLTIPIETTLLQQFLEEQEKK